MLELIYNLAQDKYRGPLAAIAKVCLYLVSLIYGFVIIILIFINKKRQQRLGCRVISVGNITLGGTGKTSLVEFIARHLKKEGHRVVILSRGYKRKAHGVQGTAHSDSSIEEMGDEPYMLKMDLGDVPVLVDADRVRAAHSAMTDYAADTVILDDSFQQWRIKKDLEIVAIDATNPFGNFRVIPRGILREPLSSLRRADVFVITKTNLNFHTQECLSFLNRINPNALVVKSIHRPVGFYNIKQEGELLKPDNFSGRTVAAVSGIADPEGFENLLTSLKADIGLVLRFPDHYPYSYKDLEQIMRQAQQKNIDTIITTQKDAVRLKPYLNSGDTEKSAFFVLRIRLEVIDDEQKFFSRLKRLYSS